MLASSLPRESLCLVRSVMTSQKEPTPSASSWMTFHWYEAADKFCNTVQVFLFTWILTLRNNCLFCILSDTLDLWQGIHRGCWDEAGCPAGGWEGPFHCRKGNYFKTLFYLFFTEMWMYAVYSLLGKRWKLELQFLWQLSKMCLSFFFFRQSNRSRRPSSQQRVIPRLPC